MFFDHQILLPVCELACCHGFHEDRFRLQFLKDDAVCDFVA